MNIIKRLWGTLTGVQNTADIVPSLMPLTEAQRRSRVSYRIRRQRLWLSQIGQAELEQAILHAENETHPNREMLYAIYKNVLRKDLVLRSQLRSANYKVIAEPSAIINTKTKKIDEERTKLFQTKWFEDVCNYTLDSEYWGYSVMEFGQLVPNTDSPKLAPNVFQDVMLIPREHICSEKQLLLVNPSDSVGLPIHEPPFNEWILSAGDPFDLGLLQACARYAIYKGFTFSDWSRSAERWGDPVLIIRSASDDEKENDAKADMAASFGNNGWAILDDDDQVELLERTNDSGYEVFAKFREALNEEISQGVNGQTATSSEKSFVGAAEVHERIMGNYTEARMRSLVYFVNDKLFPFLMSKGYDLKGYEWKPLRFLKELRDPNEPPPVPPPAPPGSQLAPPPVQPGKPQPDRQPGGSPAKKPSLPG